MGKIFDVVKWEKQTSRFNSIPGIGDAHWVDRRFSKLDRQPGNSEDYLEQAINEWEAMQPAKQRRANPAEEYEEIQRGEEIWVSIQKNSGT